MKYITTRPHEKLPERASEFESLPRYQLWKTKKLPYDELARGDILYWYDNRTRSIVWKSRVVKVESFPYDNKQEVRQKLVALFDNFDEGEEYFVKRADRCRYCLAYKVKAIIKFELPRPDKFKFLGHGWKKVDNDIAKLWGIT